MSQTQKFVSIPLKVEAIQVTPDNMIEVASWSGGMTKLEDGKAFVKLRQGKGPKVNEKFLRAYPTDFVVRMGQSFRVYPEHIFVRKFQPTVEEGIGTPIFDQVARVIREAHVAQLPPHLEARRIMGVLPAGGVALSEAMERMVAISKGVNPTPADLPWKALEEGNQKQYVQELGEKLATPVSPGQTEMFEVVGESVVRAEMAEASEEFYEDVMKGVAEGMELEKNGE